MNQQKHSNTNKQSKWRWQYSKVLKWHALWKIVAEKWLKTLLQKPLLFLYIWLILNTDLQQWYTCLGNSLIFILFVFDFLELILVFGEFNHLLDVHSIQDNFNFSLVCKLDKVKQLIDCKVLASTPNVQAHSASFFCQPWTSSGLFSAGY